MDVLKGRILKSVTIKGTLNDTIKMSGGLNIPDIIYPPTYDGAYSVTPSTEEQTLYTDGLMMDNNVTIQAMPEADLRPILIPSSDFHAVSFETDYTIDGNGEETLFCTGGGLADFVYQAGYVGTDTQADIGFYFNDTHQLPTYDGEITVTPTNQTQTLSTKSKYLTDNITIEPIPNNYGLVTWNGSVLTIS